VTLEFSLTPEQEGTAEIQRLVISRAISGQRATIKLRG
jgi:hypothetical protein